MHQFKIRNRYQKTKNFDAEFESVEKNAKSSPKTSYSYRSKTFAYSNKNKNCIKFCIFDFLDHVRTFSNFEVKADETAEKQKAYFVNVS